jgi:hypothetical protein
MRLVAGLSLSKNLILVITLEFKFGKPGNSLNKKCRNCGI